MSRTSPKMPEVLGCTSNDANRLVPFVGKKRVHQWNYSTSWNGNSKAVLPFSERTSGISRSGWRCYHCGKFVWDESDEMFALKYAYHKGLLPNFRELMSGAKARSHFQSQESFEHAAAVSRQRVEES